MKDVSKSSLRKLVKTPRLTRKLLISGFHALLLVVLTIGLQYIGNIRFDEIAFFKAFAIAKHNIFKIDRKPAGDSVVYLDVSKDVTTTPDTGMNYGRVVITDRALLAKLFLILNQHQQEYKFAICDIGFVYPSSDDTLLQKTLEKSRNVFIALTLQKGKVVKPLFRGSYGATDYTVNSGDFVKYPIFYDETTKSLPVVVVESSTPKRFRRREGLTYENNQLAFNTVIPEFYYRKDDLVEDTVGNKTTNQPNLFHLGEILPSRNFFDAYLKNKYILIGDFYQDLHGTYLGKMPGPLILFNAYLTLKNSWLAISRIWLSLVFSVFLVLSYHLFFGTEFSLENLEKPIKIGFLHDFLTKYASYLGVLIVLNIVSYSIFGIFISIFYLATYLTIIKTVIEKVAAFKKNKSLSSILDA